MIGKRKNNAMLTPLVVAVLADLDGNYDGQLDSQDTAFSELKLWQDANIDGLIDAGELKTMSEKGIQSIATVYTTNATTDSHGNPSTGSGRTVDGFAALAQEARNDGLWRRAA